MLFILRPNFSHGTGKFGLEILFFSKISWEREESWALKECSFPLLVSWGWVKKRKIIHGLEFAFTAFAKHTKNCVLKL